MQGAEDRLLATRQAGAARSGMLLQAGVAVAFLLICGVGFLIARFTREFLRALTAARDRLAASNQQLLDQIGRRERRKASFARRRRWRRSASSPAASPTISTICSA